MSETGLSDLKSIGKFFKEFTDPYERKARLMPGLLAVLPVLVGLLVLYGPRYPLLTALSSLLCGCGALYVLANVARTRGKAAEERLIRQWGGLPSILCLRHRDSYLDRITKERYHQLSRSKLGIIMPTVDDEASDPQAANEAYEAVCRELRRRTRSNRSLLFKENISYGFNRNMLGVKPIGISTSFAGVAFALLLSGAINLAPWSFSADRLLSPGLPAALTFLISALMLCFWLFHFTESAVRRVGYAYAERLLECLDSLPARRTTQNGLQM